MKKVSELVQRIENHYVSDDCIQIMAPYKNEITIFNKDGIVFSHNVDSHITINKYMEDERRKQFPYSNIPTHYSKIGLFGKINFANQLFDFEVPYIRVGDGSIIESFAVKDQDKALLINRVISGTKKTGYVTREELEDLYTKSTDKFILHLEDPKYVGEETLRISNFQPFASEEKIRNFIEKQIVNGVKDFRNYVKDCPGSTVVHYLLEHPVFLDYVEQSINNFDLTNMKFNIPLKGNRAIIVRTDENDISIQYVEANFVSVNNYRVDIIDLPVNKYTLEQLKHLSPMILKTKEPKIPLRLNPGVTKQDIQEAKQMVKTLRK